MKTENISSYEDLKWFSSDLPDMGEDTYILTFVGWPNADDGHSSISSLTGEGVPSWLLTKKR